MLILNSVGLGEIQSIVSTNSLKSSVCSLIRAAFNVGNLDSIVSVASSSTVSLGALISPSSSGDGSSASFTISSLSKIPFFLLTVKKSCL